MSLTTIEAMSQAVNLAGGRMTETDFLNQVHDLIHASGRTTSMESLKSNAFSKSRMDKANVTRVTIGADRQIWSASLALSVGDLGNAVPSMPTTASVVAPAPLMGTVKPVNDTPVGTVQVGGVFYGIPRNSPDAVAGMSDWLKSLIPSRKIFVESERQEYRLMANR